MPVKPDFYEVVRHALTHYHDLRTLETSPLRTLQVLWPLPPALLQDSIDLPLRGVAIHHLLDRALERLEERHPEEGAILTYRYQREIEGKELQKQLGLSNATLYRHINSAVEKLATLIWEMEGEATIAQEARLRHQLTFVPATVRETLVGLSAPCETLHTYLRHRMVQPRTPILVTGLGGIGKTTLLTHALTTWVKTEAPTIERILWTRIIPTRTGEQQVERVIDLILSQLGQQLEVPLLTLPTVEQRLRQVATYLTRFRQRFVIVIDNVESAVEHSGALQFAQVIAQVALVLIGSRRDPTLTEIGTAVFPVHELAKPHAEALVTHESQQSLPAAEVKEIVKVVGGHPLALLLVVAQRRRLPLARVLDGLKRSSELADVLYERIYLRAWELLNDVSKSMLIGLSGIPLEGTYLPRLLQLARVATPHITQRDMEVAIGELSTLNLVQVTNGAEPIYSLHRLTYRFIEQRIGIDVPDDP